MSALTPEQLAALPKWLADSTAKDGPLGPYLVAIKRIESLAPSLAATVIEQQAEIDRLREALAPVADLAEVYDPEDGDDDQHCWVTEFTPKLRDLRRARAALAVKP